MKFHPDRNPGDHEARGEIQGGQGGLRGSVATRRSARSTTSTATRASTPRAGGGGGFGGGDAFSDIFGDVFGDIFGGGAPRRRALAGVPRRRSALRARARPRAGGVRPRRRDRRRRARRVRDLRRQRRGQGHASPSTCETCGGSGQVRMSAGLLPAAADLPACRGTRHRSSSNPCDTCLGQGRVRRQQDARGEDSRPASTPATASGWRARARPGATAARRAICTSRCTCASTRSSSATASTCRCEVPVSFATAALGGTVEVPTLDGDVIAQDSGRDAVRARVPAARQGRQARARRCARRPVLPRGGRDAGEAHRRAEASCCASSRSRCARARAIISPRAAFLARGREALLRERCAAERHERRASSSRDLRRLGPNGAGAVARCAPSRSLPIVARRWLHRQTSSLGRTPRAAVACATGVPSSGRAGGTCACRRGDRFHVRAAIASSLRVRGNAAADRHRHHRITTSRSGARSQRPPRQIADRPGAEHESRCERCCWSW